jgi:hypothetical protein
MRRLVDSAIPALCIIALAPASIQIMDLPDSLERSLGEFIGRIWAVTLTLAMIVICTGIALRSHRPEWSFRCEWPALIFSGFISMIYGASIFLITGMRGWAAAWFIWAIGAYFLFRFVELSLARSTVKRVTI